METLDTVMKQEKPTHPSVERLLQASGMSQEETAKAIDEFPQTITNWKKRGVSKAGALKAAARFGVAANWILTGEGKKEESNITKVVEWDSDTPVDNDEVEIPFYKEVLVSCGSGSLAEMVGNETRKLRLSKATLRQYGVEASNAYALTAFGNSMSPVINNGATVYVDVGRTNIIDGKIYAINHGGLFKFKYLYRLPKGGVKIVSENKEEYPDEYLTAEEIMDQEFCVVAYAFNVQNSLP
ncbi:MULTISPECIES: S24 family peptidase [Acinetobacter calcoaceticus/baumannii complex]|uniref:LexA family transcriptional regulator n=1 Tax=Acinetobacter calcoaceticus/baumannii complex TaxID=909768 RepID=UPI0002B969A2|nr:MULTISPECIES: S24 family peptidase [Acinetobacter calcoaceticus/baumannii complex]EMC9749897.1 helix-turn-helix transcriptional regulator [Acinetobacter baumannii]EXH05649.1 repressor protein CI [Acinetobacter baumannii 1188188]NUG10154.1 helix-turn-helix transcriptional regulator [Acinetobacter seifertii]RSO81220.1 helix-turn-helix transcriptional regulator [Acinetobacter baumannii]RSP67084.1 helix-turn-helix transcriptional regulator [Acinetobacter baumannii]